jgi:hypothetical protein
MVVICSVPAVSAVLTASTQPDCTIAAAGDIAEAGGDQEQTAKVVSSIRPNVVLTLGDNAYEDGSDADFQRFYDPAWGKFKRITRPAVGNHEYNTPDAAGYFHYFDVQPYYAFDLCGWRLYSLNREIGGGDRAKELSWLTGDLAAHHGRPMLAYWHEPRWTSGTKHGSDEGADDLWRAVVKGGVRVVLNGHEHAYERFAELGVDGRRSPGGTREIIVGEGGSNDLSGFGDPMAASEKHIDGAHGVLAMRLRSDGYDWRLVQVGGQVADQGTQQLSGQSAKDTSTMRPGPGPARPTDTPGAGWSAHGGSTATTVSTVTTVTTPPAGSADASPTGGRSYPTTSGGTGFSTGGSWSPWASPAPALPGGDPGVTTWWVRANQGSYVKGTEPTAVFGGASELLVDAPDPARHITFVSFDLTRTPTGTTRVSGRLYLRATTDLPTGVDVYPAPSGWSQANLSWATQPMIHAAPIGRIGPAHAGDWVSLDVSSVLRAGSTVSLALTGISPGRAAGRFASDETVSPPTLYISLSRGIVP